MGRLTLLPAAAPGGGFGARFGHDEGCRLRRQADIPPLEQILERVPAGARLLELETEREHGELVYDIEYLTDEGVVRKVYLDAASGELVKEHRHE